MYAYLARGYGWTIEHISEMDEFDLQHALSDLLVIQKQELALEVRSAALAAKAGFGSKEADREINKIVKMAQQEKKDLDAQEAQIGVANTVGTKLDLKKLAGAKLNE